MGEFAFRRGGLLPCAKCGMLAALLVVQSRCKFTKNALRGTHALASPFGRGVAAGDGEGEDADGEVLRYFFLMLLSNTL